MKNLKLNSCISFGAAALFAVACSTTGSDSSFSPTGPAFDVTVAPQTLEVCKTGPAGTYSFTAVAGGNANTNDVLDDAFDLVVAADGGTACTTVFTRTVSDDGGTDAPASIVVTEAAHTGTALSDITITGPGAQAAEKDVAGSKVTTYVNAFHSEKVTFVNVSTDEGCTLTQGYWKNHSEEWAGLADDPFFNSGKTWLQILQTPPKKGDAYIQLAHQYIAAYLNIQGGASTTAAVDAAMATALTYFTNGTGNITGLATTLDDYNNGLIGPGHCEDGEVIIE